MIKILAIGNSFSEDATRYLHQLARSAGVETKVVNLYIGGCSLERHWENIESEKTPYQYQLNGVITDRYVTIEEALAEEAWDIIVTQQASHDSGWENTYEPFLGLIVDYLHHKAPQAKLFLQETWAYEIDSNHGAFMRYNRNQDEMYQRLRKCYITMAEKYDLGLIPCGDVIQQLRQVAPFVVQEGGRSLCRDGFHMSIPYGRYILACVWANTLLNVDLTGSLYMPETTAEEESPDPELIDLIVQNIQA